MTKGSRVLREAFQRIEGELPRRAVRALRWIRHPSSRWVRLPLAVLLLMGGVLAILPGFGVWMLPVGLLLLACDVPPIRRPVAALTLRGVESWATVRRRIRR